MATEEILKEARLRFTNDKKPGFTRQIINDKFTYYDLDGKRITENDTIERINKLAIPPAYKRVWISPYANGHLQATGYDSKGRKQYRYHPLWNKISQEEKFTKILDFAKHLPKIRATVRRHLEESRTNREKVLAAVVWLLENTLIRIGNEEYEEENKSYGLTTLKNRHVTVSSTHNIVFQFKGKSGVYHKVRIKSKKVAKVIRRCKEIPGQDLFEFFDEEGAIQTIDSYDVNEYLKEITGEEITAKDFRTWGGTVLAACAFDKLGLTKEEDSAKQNVLDTVKEVASFLRNRPATCRKYYIHPVIIESYSKGYVISNLSDMPKKKRYRNIKGLDEKENQVLSLLSHMLAAKVV